MKAIAFFAIGVLILSLGCVQQEHVQKARFADMYSNLKNEQEKRNLGTPEGIQEFLTYLHNEKNKLGDTKDEIAMKKIIDIKIAVLNAQFDIIKSNSIFLSADCNQTKINNSIQLLTYAKNNITQAINAIEEFKRNFSEFYEITQMNNATLNTLYTIENQTVELINEINNYANETCGV